MLLEIGLFVGGILVAVFGWIGKKLWDSYKNRGTDISTLQNRVDTLWKWAFGREDDATDKGLAAEVDNGFNRIEDDIQEVQRRQETYHEAEMEQFEELVMELHDEEDVDIEREEVLRD